MEEKRLIADVAVENTLFAFDKLFGYSVPAELSGCVKAGVRVVVPFGKGNKKSIGLVTRTYKEAEYNEALKPVSSLADRESLVTEEMMKIIFWLKENTFCTFFDAYKSVVPTGFSYSFSKRDLHTRRKCRSTGAPLASACLQTRRL